MLSYGVCLCVIWPLLLLRFGLAPLLRPRPLALIPPHLVARQWRAIRRLPGGRVLVLRIQAVAL